MTFALSEYSRVLVYETFVKWAFAKIGRYIAMIFLFCQWKNEGSASKYEGFVEISFESGLYNFLSLYVNILQNDRLLFLWKIGFSFCYSDRLWSNR